MSASLAPECNELKERYDTCFLKWYSERFLRNKATPLQSGPISSSASSSSSSGASTSSNSTHTSMNEKRPSTTECDPLFESYSQCLWRALEQKGVAGMVMEARKEAAETDREHMTAPTVAGRN